VSKLSQSFIREKEASESGAKLVLSPNVAKSLPVAVLLPVLIFLFFQPA
jgi:hypothetical protein